MHQLCKNRLISLFYEVLFKTKAIEVLIFLYRKVSIFAIEISSYNPATALSVNFLLYYDSYLATSSIFV